MTEPAETAVEDVLFNVLKPQRREAIATIETSAEAWRVRIERIEERPKRLTVDMSVRVTGSPEKIASFSKETGGRRSHDPPRTLRRWVGGLLDEIQW